MCFTAIISASPPMCVWWLYVVLHSWFVNKWKMWFIIDDFIALRVEIRENKLMFFVNMSASSFISLGFLSYFYIKNSFVMVLDDDNKGVCQNNIRHLNICGYTFQNKLAIRYVNLPMMLKSIYYSNILKTAEHKFIRF